MLRLSPQARLAIISHAVNGFVVAVLVGACVLAGFDAVNSQSRERWEQANQTRSEMVARLRHLEQEMAALHERLDEGGDEPS